MPKQKTYEGTYLILSLKWSDGLDRLNWWGADNNGYTYDIDRAGRYSAEKVAAHSDYYDNEETTRAVPEDDVFSGKLGPIQRVVRASYRRPRAHYECHVCLAEIIIHPDYSPIRCDECDAYTCSICYDEGRCNEVAASGGSNTTGTGA